MKPCIAAALALAAWCLILPPSDEDLTPHPDAPLYKWHVMTAPFATIADCEANRASMEQMNSQDPDTNVTSNIGIMLRHFGEGLKDGKCVKTDDPRLIPPTATPRPSGRGRGVAPD
jgi:hypothetical protein